MTRPAGGSVIYQWLSDSGYFIHALLPSACRLEASIHDRARDVVDRVPEGTGLFAFHLNCTLTERFPAERAALVRALESRGIRVLNAGATDISKRNVHRICGALGFDTLDAGAEGNPDELVIVKTDLNFGGDSEWALSDEERAALGVGKGSDIIWTPSHYRVVARRDVQPAWWTDTRLVCERFVTNAGDRWYRAFLHDRRIAVCELSNPNPIKKVGDSRVLRMWTSSGDAGPETFEARLTRDVERFARAIGLDFGTVDAVADDQGRSFIIDANATAAYNHPIPGLIDRLGTLPTT